MGVLLAAVSSLILVFTDTGKKYLSHKEPIAAIVWTNLLMAIGITGVYLAFVPPPVLNGTFWIYALVGALVVFVGEALFMMSLKCGDFSLSQPFKAFLPIFGIVIAFFLLKEVPSKIALLGAAITSLGAYCMFLEDFSASALLRPFRSAISTPASRYMLLSGIFGALFLTIQKAAASPEAAMAYVGAVFVGEFICFSGWLWFVKINPLILFKKYPVLVPVIGICWGVGMVLTYMAVQLTLVATVLVIIQLQPLLAMPIGAYFFKENVGARVFPALAMITGVLTLVIWG